MNIDTIIVIISLVLSITGVIFASITAPLLIARHSDKLHREDRDADWARQDATAARLQRAQKAQQDQASETARLLLAANDRVAHTAEIADRKLDIIHTLVNSAMTTAMQSELDAIERELAMMREVMALNTSAGREPTAEVLAAIETTKAKIVRLTSELDDRARAQGIANVQIQDEHKVEAHS